MNAHRIPHRLTLICLSTLAAGQADAALFDFLEHHSLTGYVTFDAYLGNADDQIFAGLNTFGAASQFVNSNGTYGFLGGTMDTEGLTPFGYSDQQVFGVNRHYYLEMWGEWNLNAPPTFNNWFDQSLNLDSPSIITISEDQTYTSSFVLDDFSPISGRIQFTGSGRYLLNGQDASGLYTGDLLTHFNFVTPLLPNGWVGVAHETQNYEVLDGPYAGLTGYNTMTFFSTDPLSVPVPQPEALGPPWEATGPTAISSDGSKIAIGDTVFDSGADATATLSGGNTVIVGSLTIGGSGNQAMTVEGPGTQLTASDIETSASAGGSTAVSILDGGVISSEFIWFSGTTDLVISGSGSELELGCADTGCSGHGVFLGLGGTTTIKDGGQVSARGFENGSAGLGLFDGIFAIEGAGSTVTITGTQSADGSAPPQTAIFVDGSAVLNVTNGGRVAVAAGNLGFSGVAVGAYAGAFFPPGASPAARVVVDGAGSLVDAGPLFSLGSLSFFDPVTSEPLFEPILDGGGLSEAIVSNGGVIKADLILIGPSGALSGSGGTLEGAVENRGTIAPGLSPGILNIIGDFEQTADGMLLIEIGGTGPGMFDVLNVSGTATLGGTLRIELVDGFTPGPDDQFDFLAASSFEGGFDHFMLPTFGVGKTFAVSLGPNGFSASVTAVPLPGALWLLAPAVAGLLASARRRLRDAA